MEDKKYYEVTYDDLLEGVKFKFRKLNPVDLLNICTKDGNKLVKGKNDKDYFQEILSNILWTKNDIDWFPLISEDGSSRLPEYDDQPSLGLDLLFLYKEKVINPVFTESKTFQNITSQRRVKNTN